MPVVTDCAVRVPKGYVDDVQQFLDENKIEKTVRELTCEEFFKYYCQWNGIFWDSALWELAKLLLDADEVGLPYED